MKHEKINKKTIFMGEHELSSHQISLIRDAYIASMIPELIETLRDMKKVHFKTNKIQGTVDTYSWVQRQQENIMNEFLIKLDRTLIENRKKR